MEPPNAGCYDLSATQPTPPTTGHYRSTLRVERHLDLLRADDRASVKLAGEGKRDLSPDCCCKDLVIRKELML